MKHEEGEGSRLEKLLKLIREGKTEEIRRAAAEQVAGIVKSQPTQVFSLVAKLAHALVGPQWEGRIAASYCFELIAKHCQHHSVVSLREAACGAGSESELKEMRHEWLQLEHFDIKDVIKQAKPLVASSGSEFEVGSLSSLQDLQQQKKQLKARLGLDGISGQVINADEFIADEDLAADVEMKTQEEKKSAASVLEGLSAREKAMMRAQKKRKMNNGAAKETHVHDEKALLDISKASEDMWNDTVSGGWPFGRISDKLCIDLLHPSWERRHGAALGLRSILQHHLNSAGIYASIDDRPSGWLASGGSGMPSLLSVTEADVNRASIENLAWLEECTIHILCVLALERFGDYLSDDVVAPVRETAAQVLGILAAGMSDGMFQKTLCALADIAQADHWESRHGALSGLKYVLTARSNIDTATLAKTLSVIRRGLEDQIEDVRSVSAECLMPCIAEFEKSSSRDTVAIVDLLWDSLLSLDPLNTATKSASKVLEMLFSEMEDTSSIMKIENIPRLWYHFPSRVSSVRSAAVQCYKGIVNSARYLEKVPESYHVTGMFACLQVIMTDENLDIAMQAYETCTSLISQLSSEKSACLGNKEILDTLLASTLFSPGKQYVRPTCAELPPIMDEMTDMGEMGRPVHVQKHAASERRYLLCGVLARRFASSDSGMKQKVASMMASNWSEHSPLPKSIIDTFLEKLARKSNFIEFEAPYKSIVEKFAKYDVSKDVVLKASADDLVKLLSGKCDQSNLSSLLDRLSAIRTAEDQFSVSVSGCIATAVVKSEQIPQKLNAIIQPLIAGTRREKDEFLHRMACNAIAKLVWIARDRSPSPSSKIIKNLCLFACSDKRSILDASNNQASDEDQDTKAEESGSKSATQITSEGGIMALKELVRLAGPNLTKELPGLWDHQIVNKMKLDNKVDESALHEHMKACFVMQCISPEMHEGLLAALDHVLSILLPLLTFSNNAVQKASARAVSAICQRNVERFLPIALQSLDSMLKDGSPEQSRFGGITAIRILLDNLDIDVVPFIPLLVIYLMRRMGDSVSDIRKQATRCFAKAITLLPLSHGIAAPPNLSESQKVMLQKDGNFLEQLLNNEHVDDYKLPFSLQVGSLRRYQQEGINWLAFLKRFGLHGILADDMGLGKTIQATAIMGAVATERKIAFESTKDPNDMPKPSLVVCPATLVSHWPHEIAKFISSDILKPLRVHGTPSERQAAYKEISDASVVVISYETLRSDIKTLSTKQWMYIILDEGHAIRNPTSKLAIAARELHGMHRLILSGTPVQNSVLEVWAMFEFLMPGYLGDQKSFNAKYGKSVEKAKKSKKTSAQEQASVLALQALHKQVMPFILRRTKDQVLKDLPPKIIQDIMCDPSPLQLSLLKDLDSSGIEETLKSMGSSSDSQGHVFQALHYLRKLCSHPLFVLNKENESHRDAIRACIGDSAAKNWESAMSTIHNQLQHSPKLSALKELLLDSGLANEEGESDISDAGHRFLIFAQTKGMLNMIESAVLNP
eukprot:jgi/Picre1/27525/NNA_000492.t1